MRTSLLSWAVAAIGLIAPHGWAQERIAAPLPAVPLAGSVCAPQGCVPQACAPSMYHSYGYPNGGGFVDPKAVAPRFSPLVKPGVHGWDRPAFDCWPAPYGDPCRPAATLTCVRPCDPPHGGGPCAPQGTSTSYYGPTGGCSSAGCCATLGAPVPCCAAPAPSACPPLEPVKMYPVVGPHGAYAGFVSCAGADCGKTCGGVTCGSSCDGCGQGETRSRSGGLLEFLRRLFKGNKHDSGSTGHCQSCQETMIVYEAGAPVTPTAPATPPAAKPTVIPPVAPTTPKTMPPAEPTSSAAPAQSRSPDRLNGPISPRAPAALPTPQPQPLPIPAGFQPYGSPF